jgi:hypothetical protein
MPAGRHRFDLTGQVFGRLTVLEYAGKKYGTHNAWLCECSCASKTKVTVTLQCLREGNTRSCGCIVRREGEPKPATKICTKCRKELPYTPEFFSKTPKSRRWGLHSQCKKCLSPRRNKKRNENGQNLKLEVFIHYSKSDPPKCECCGITGLAFLTLDHINNDGKEDRKKHKCAGMYFYAKMKKLRYPNHLRVMCWNCNMGRFHSPGGVCPHKTNS